MSLLSLDSVCKCAQYSCYVHLGSKPEQKQVGGGVTPHTRWEGGWAVNTRHGTMCIYIYIWICTCTCTCTCTYIYVCVFVYCICIFMHMHMYICIFVCVYVYMSICVYVYMCILYVYMRRCVHLYACLWINNYLYIWYHLVSLRKSWYHFVAHGNHFVALGCRSGRDITKSNAFAGSFFNLKWSKSFSTSL